MLAAGRSFGTAPSLPPTTDGRGYRCPVPLESGAREADPGPSGIEGSASDPASSDRMPRWIPRVVLLAIALVVGAWAALVALGKIRDLIVWLIVSLFLSFALEPAVNWLAARGWRRGLATGVALLTLIALGVLLVASMIPLVIDQVRGLISSLPGWIERLSSVTERWFGIELSTERLVEQVTELSTDVGTYAANVAGNVLGFGTAVIGAVFQLLTIGLFTFYLVADGPRLRRAVCSVLPPARQREVLWAWEVAVDRTGGYLYSRLLLATVAGIVTYVVLAILGVPYPVPLAVWVGLISQFIPTVGTYIAMVVPLLVALSESPLTALLLLVFFVVYQQVENLVLSPRITARTMQMHPAVAFGSVIVGASLFGAAGAFLAIPAAAIIQAGLSLYVKRHEVLESELTTDRPPARKERPGDPGTDDRPAEPAGTSEHAGR